MINISVAKDFSVYPGGRTPEDGPFSGEIFREEHLIPYLTTKEKINIDLDGTRGYGSSFLEEAFGGLVRKGFSSDEIFNSITFQTSSKSLEEEIKRYIFDADQRK